MCVTYVLHLAILAVLLPMAQNHEGKFTKADVPLWKQRACEKSQKQKANSHYICDDKGDVKCLPGWQGDLCQVPMCRRGCDPMNGYCQRPGECRCRIGYTGELCDKCIPLPGCQHGDCTKPFECLCRTGWDGLFCTEPTCRKGCHNTRGYCESPGECRCRLGWAGRNCSDCSVLPGCQHGTCGKPLECNCKPGYTGLLCQMPICNAECDKQHGYCKRPGECRCKVGWKGPKCDECFPYPGCVNGSCGKPWECNCKPGWGGVLCDEALAYCKENPSICENGGKCVSLSREDGNYHCRCKKGYLGKNCEIIDEFMLTSTAAPRITPPPRVVLDYDEDFDVNSAENLIHKANKTTVQKKQNSKGQTHGTKVTSKRRETPSTAMPTESSEFITKTTTSIPLADISWPSHKEDLENITNISGEDIIGTATTRMMPSSAISPIPVTINVNFNTKSNPATKKIRRKVHKDSQLMNNSTTNSSHSNSISEGVRTEPSIINPNTNLENEATTLRPTPLAPLPLSIPIQLTLQNVPMQNAPLQNGPQQQVLNPQKHNQNFMVVTTSSNEEGDDDDDCDENEEECVYVTTNDAPPSVAMASQPVAMINTPPTIPIPINRLDQQAYLPVMSNDQQVTQNLVRDKPNYVVLTTTSNEDEDAGVEEEDEEEDDGEDEECGDDDDDEDCEYEDEEEEEE